MSNNNRNTSHNKTPFIHARRQHTIRDTTLFVNNLHPSVSEEMLIKIIRPYGRIIDVHYMWHMDGPLAGQPKGFAFIDMSTAQEVEAVCSELNGKIVCGRNIGIRRAADKPPPPSIRTSRPAPPRTEAADDADGDTIGKRSRITEDHSDHRDSTASTSKYTVKKQIVEIDDKISSILKALSK